MDLSLAITDRARSLCTQRQGPVRRTASRNTVSQTSVGTSAQGEPDRSPLDKHNATSTIGQAKTTLGRRHVIRGAAEGEARTGY